MDQDQQLGIGHREVRSESCQLTVRQNRKRKLALSRDPSDKGLAGLYTSIPKHMQSNPSLNPTKIPQITRPTMMTAAERLATAFPWLYSASATFPDRWLGTPQCNCVN